MPAIASTDSQTASDLNLFERRASRTRPHEILETLLLLAILLLPIDVGVRRVHISREQLAQARAWIESKLRRPARVEAETETAASLAQLKDARSRVRLSDGLSDAKEIQPPRISEPVKLDDTFVVTQAKPDKDSAVTSEAKAHSRFQVGCSMPEKKDKGNCHRLAP